MAGASTPEIASSVVNAGAIGSLPLAGIKYSQPEKLQTILTKYKALVAPGIDYRNVNLNFFCYELPDVNNKAVNRAWIQHIQSYFKPLGIATESYTDTLRDTYDTFARIEEFPAYFDAIIEFRPKIISFHFGIPPARVLARLRAAGIKLFISVTNVDELKQVLAAGFDGVILQGYNAGGHRGNFIRNDPADTKLEARALTEEVLAYLETTDTTTSDNIFIIPAGGISTGAQIAAYLRIPGVSATQLGSVFLATPESSVPQYHKDLLTSHPDGFETILTPYGTGRAARAFKTPFMDKLYRESAGLQLPDYPLPADVFRGLNGVLAQQTGRREFNMYLVGAGHKNLSADPVEVVIERLINEYQSELSN
ncbi:hypothetical protein D0Z00_003566 [Geotrichum galactomycetum]|uniref:Uncharacterized protein n=1 Tax=Geotrichum galactomycetum TaxID=27317 RepID=A0ACB6V0Z8_9ASCO|nr:hypothetical protein D0Z00_003566 [Geotrichum candidum]